MDEQLKEEGQEEQRMLNMRSAVSDIVESGYRELVKRLRPVLPGIATTTEMNVLCGLTLRITRVAIGTNLLVEKGLDEEAQILCRSVQEAYVNLCYIMYSGPLWSDRKGNPEKSTHDLCLQFTAYGDLAYLKLLNGDPEHARATFKKRKGMTDAQFDSFMAGNLQLAADAASKFGCTDKAWHMMSLPDRAKVVLKHPPPFMDVDLVGRQLTSFVRSNSAVHGDALSIRSQYNDLGTGLMELTFKSDGVWGDLMAFLAISSWRAVGWFLNDLAWVETMVQEQLGAVLRKRFEEAPVIGEKLILLPDWIKDPRP